MSDEIATVENCEYQHTFTDMANAGLLWVVADIYGYADGNHTIKPQVQFMGNLKVMDEITSHKYNGGTLGFHVDDPQALALINENITFGVISDDERVHADAMRFRIVGKLPESGNIEFETSAMFHLPSLKALSYNCGGVYKVNGDTNRNDSLFIARYEFNEQFQLADIVWKTRASMYAMYVQQALSNLTMEKDGSTM